MEGKLTVYFDDPFWVGVYEKQDENGYAVARVVFGSEPGDAQLYEFVRQHFDEFRFEGDRTGPRTGGLEERGKNYKRIQREVRKAMRERGIGTRAQQAMKQAMTQVKEERHTLSAAEHAVDAEKRFQKQQEKKKEKHRGH